MKKIIIHHHHFETYQSDLNRFNDLNQYLENQNYTYEMSSQLSENYCSTRRRRS